MTDTKLDPFQILALSGGGYKGLYTATVIADFEKHSQKSFSHHFDLIAGTSIGGIIALALACEIPAQTMVTLLKENGQEIFKPLPKLCRLNPKRFLRAKTGFDWDRGLKGAKHDNNLLKEKLLTVFEERTIGDLNHRVMIPTINWTKGEQEFFKTPHNSNYSRNKEISQVDIALATSAAPIFFPN